VLLTGYKPLTAPAITVIEPLHGKLQRSARPNVNNNSHKSRLQSTDAAAMTPNNNNQNQASLSTSKTTVSVTLRADGKNWKD
jgi:hypothetical protein